MQRFKGSSEIIAVAFVLALTIALALFVAPIFSSYVRSSMSSTVSVSGVLRSSTALPDGSILAVFDIVITCSGECDKNATIAASMDSPYGQPIDIYPGSSVALQRGITKTSIAFITTSRDVFITVYVGDSRYTIQLAVEPTS
jgi:hypothetical protein